MPDYAVDDDRITEWEEGLPSTDDIPPLYQPLISPALASAFSVPPELHRTILELNRASQTTFSKLRVNPHPLLITPPKSILKENHTDSAVVEDEDADLDRVGSESIDDGSTRTSSKRARLVWTPQLHKRFVEVVARLGIKNAVPKTIMQMMNVEGLSRENVASHLQKYRLYLKRMHQGVASNDEAEGPSSSDPVFGSIPVNQSSRDENGNGNGNIPMMYPPHLMQMSVYGHHMGLGTGHGFESHSHNMLQQRDWPGNMFGSYSHVDPNQH